MAAGLKELLVRRRRQDTDDGTLSRGHEQSREPQCSRCGHQMEGKKKEARSSSRGNLVSPCVADADTTAGWVRSTVSLGGASGARADSRPGKWLAERTGKLASWAASQHFWSWPKNTSQQAERQQQLGQRLPRPHLGYSDALHHGSLIRLQTQQSEHVLPVELPAAQPALGLSSVGAGAGAPGH